MKTNNILKTIALIILIIYSNAIFSQQDPMYTQYMFNISSVNPAANGMIDESRFLSLNRFQFVGLDGAPTTYSLSADIPIPLYNSAIGVNYAFDKLGPERSNNIYIDYSYHVNLTRKIKMGMGIKGGLKIYSTDFSDIRTKEIDDDVFAHDVKGSLMPNFGLGVMVYSKDFFVGISSPKLINHVLDGTDDASGAEERHFFLIGGYNWEINNNLVFKPTVYMKYVSNIIPSVDVSANFQIYNKFIAGLAFRSYDAVSILTQIEVYKGLNVGYVYDISINKLRQGSHEILLSYRTPLFKTKENNSKFR